MTENEFSLENTLIPDENIGIIRRIWRGRKWYGAEWYITVFGATLLVLIILMTLLAPIISPYDPNNMIAPPFVAPGGGQVALVTRSGLSS